MTFGTSRMKRRQSKRRANRKLRKSGPETAYLGGSKGDQDSLLRGAKRNAKEEEKRTDEGYSDLQSDSLRLQDKAAGAEDEYQSSRSNAAGSRSEYRDSINGIGSSAGQASQIRNQSLQSAISERDNAFRSNSLTGSADSILARRAAEVAGSPTIGQATDTAVSAMGQAAQQRLGLAGGRINRQAMGLAGGMGEGGALAMQQAMASAGEGNRDALLDSNAQQNELGANMRFNAAQVQNQQDIDSANLGLTTRMGAAQSERANQMAVADANAAARLATGGANAQTTYDAALQGVNARAGLMGADTQAQAQANNRSMNLTNAASNAVGNQAQFAQQGQRDAMQDQQFLLGTAAGIDQAENQRRYNEAVKSNGFQKFVSTVFDPGDLRGSGSKGIVG